MVMPNWLVLSGLGIVQNPVLQGRLDFVAQILGVSRVQFLSTIPQRIHHIPLFRMSTEKYRLLECDAV
jgi:hypothetical protein